jgi:hypothetical protein
MPREPNEERERSSLLRPGRPRRDSASPRSVSGIARNLFRLTRLVSRSRSSAASRSDSAHSEGSRNGSPFQRRCIVNVRYANGRTKGGWRAHGFYVERESAKGDITVPDELRDRVRTGAIDSDRLGLAKTHSMASLAETWQKAGDQRIFKIILSPEDAGADFASLADAVIGRIEQHVGSPLSWAGVVHRNTDHPHAHLIVRGRMRTDESLKLPPAMIRKGLREVAQTAITRQLGPRTMEDVERQRSVEVTANRVTPADRRLVRQSAIYGKDRAFILVGTASSPIERARLTYLKELGLAKHDSQDGWLLRTEALDQLRQVKDLQDRARILFRSGVAISDPHAPMEFSSFSKKLIGRVLLNSEDERTGALQTAFETTEGKIEIIRHDGTLRAAWGRGQLQPGSIVTIDSLRSDTSRLYVASVGMDRDVVGNAKLLDSLAKRMREMDLGRIVGAKGWMGEFKNALESKSVERRQERGR